MLRDLPKLGYKGTESCEVLLQDARVPVANLLGGVEGRGMQQVLSVLETGRINVAARALGIAQAAYDEAMSYAGQRQAFGQRVDLESGMAKVLASEAAQECSLIAMQVHGGYGYSKEFVVERLYRDAPLMMIGEGTNDILRMVIAKALTSGKGSIG